MASCFAPERMVLESDQIKKMNQAVVECESLEILVLLFLWTNRKPEFLLTNKNDKLKPSNSYSTWPLTARPPATTVKHHNRLLISSLWVCFRIVRMPSAAFICWSSCHMISLPQHDKRWNPSTNSLQKIWRDKLEDLPWRNWFEILKVSEHSILPRSIPTKRNWLGEKIQPPTLHPNNKTHFPGSLDFGQSNMQSCLRHSTHTQWPHGFTGPSSRSKSKESSVKFDDLSGFQCLSQMQTTKNEWQCTYTNQDEFVISKVFKQLLNLGDMGIMETGIDPWKSEDLYPSTLLSIAPSFQKAQIFQTFQKNTTTLGFFRPKPRYLKTTFNRKRSFKNHFNIWPPAPPHFEG